MEERRLINRLTKYWEGLRKEALLPDYAMVNASTIADIWPFCIALQLQPGSAAVPQFQIINMGDDIVKMYDENLIGQVVSPSQKHFKAALIITQAANMLGSHEVMNEKGKFVSSRNKIVRFRSCMVPFGSADGHITHTLAGISWKEF